MLSVPINAQISINKEDIGRWKLVIKTSIESIFIPGYINLSVFLLTGSNLPFTKDVSNVLKAVVPILKESGGGSITALTTAAIHRYISTDGLSSIPKSGVQHLCTAIAREEGHHGIRANCVAVGLIAVGLSQEIDSPPGGILDQWMNQVPLGRAGAPEELFDTVVFLASENAGYISGQSLPVDGGYSA